MSNDTSHEAIQVLGLGELLWDCFSDRRLPGGAPANVAFHAQQLGLSAAVATRVGSDDLGKEITRFLVGQGLNTSLVQQDPAHPTGTVTIWSDANTGNHFRFLENSAWDFLEASDELTAAVRTAAAICFGSLAQRRPISRATIYRCLQAAPKDCLIIYDVNLRPPFYSRDGIVKSIERAKIVKLNDGEVQVLSKLLDFATTDEVRFAKRLLDGYRQLELVCITRGGNGCLAVSCDEQLELAGVPIEVVDTVGAGDAFTAGILFGRLEKWPLLKTLELANHFGALVAASAGAMPPLRDALDDLKQELSWSFRETPLM